MPARYTTAGSGTSDRPDWSAQLAILDRVDRALDKPAGWLGVADQNAAMIVEGAAAVGLDLTNEWKLHAYVAGVIAATYATFGQNVTGLASLQVLIPRDVR